MNNNNNNNNGDNAAEQREAEDDEDRRQSFTTTTSSTSKFRYEFQFQDAENVWSLSSEDIFSSKQADFEVDGLVLIETTVKNKNVNATNSHHLHHDAKDDRADDDEDEEMYDIATDKFVKEQACLLKLAGGAEVGNDPTATRMQEIPKRYRKVAIVNEVSLKVNVPFFYNSRSPSSSTSSSSSSSDSFSFIAGLLTTLSVCFSQLDVPVSSQELFQFLYPFLRQHQPPTMRCHIEELVHAATHFIEAERRKLLDTQGARERIGAKSATGGSVFSPASFGRIRCVKERITEGFLPGVLQSLFETSSSSSSAPPTDTDISMSSSALKISFNDGPQSSSPRLLAARKLTLSDHTSSINPDESPNALAASAKICLFIFDSTYFYSQNKREVQNQKEDVSGGGDAEEEEEEDWGCCIIEGFDAENGIVHVCDVTALSGNYSREKQQKWVRRSRFGRRWKMTIDEMIHSGRRAFDGGDRKDLSFPVLILEKN